METAGMEDIYSKQLKYIESWLYKKERKGFEEYWVVLKNCYMFFFKDQNTHAKEQYAGYIEIPGTSKCTKGKSCKEGKCEFSLNTSKKKFCFRRRSDSFTIRHNSFPLCGVLFDIRLSQAQHDILRDRWVYAIDLAAKRKEPGPLPGDPDFTDEMNNNNTLPKKNKKLERSNTLPAAKPEQPGTKISRSQSCQRNPADSRGVVNRIREIQIEDKPLSIPEDSEEYYEGVFLPPSWYLKGLSRQEAESLLQSQQVGTYLLRDTESVKKADYYTLSFRDEVKIKHHKIEPKGGGYVFHGAEGHIFQSATDAVIFLMQSKHAHLNPREYAPETFERTAGDGIEDCSPFDEGYPDEVGQRPSLTSPISPFSPSEGSSGYSFETRFPPARPKVERKRFSMKDRPLPEVPGAENYANASAIIFAANVTEQGYPDRSDQESYVNMQRNSPPVPPKRSSVKADPLYQNLPPKVPSQTGNSSPRPPNLSTFR